MSGILKPGCKTDTGVINVDVIPGFVNHCNCKCPVKWTSLGTTIYVRKDAEQLSWLCYVYRGPLHNLDHTSLWFSYLKGLLSHSILLRFCGPLGKPSQRMPSLAEVKNLQLIENADILPVQLLTPCLQNSPHPHPVPKLGVCTFLYQPFLQRLAFGFGVSVFKFRF